MQTLSLVGLILGIAIYSFTSWKGWNQYLAVFAAVLVVALTSSLPIYDSYAKYWMSGFSGYLSGYFLVFFVGSIFGKLLDASHGTETFALTVMKISKKYAYVVMIILVAFMAYIGISPWQALFFIGPITLTVLKESGIPRRFATALIYFGSCTLGYTIPGCARMTNYMATTIMGVPLYAGAVVGIVTVLFLLVAGCILFRKLVDQALRNGETFVVRETDTFITEEEAQKVKRPPLWLIMIPIAGMMIAVNMKDHFGYPAEFGFLIGVVLCFICLRDYLDVKKWYMYVGQAAPSAVNTTLMLGCVFGFGKVAVQTPAYTFISDLVMNIPGGPLVSVAVAINIIAGTTASGTSAINLLLPAMGDAWIARGATAGSIARIAAISQSAMDSLPHNSGVVSMIANMGETHKSAYMPVFWMTVVLPFAGIIVALALYTIFPALM